MAGPGQSRRAFCAVIWLTTACSVYEPELVDGAAPGAGAGGKGGTSSAGTAGTAEGGSATSGAAGSGAGGRGGTGGAPEPMDPYLTGDLGTPPTTVILSSEGTSHWVHWGLKGPTDVNQKADVTSQLLDFKPVGSETPSAYTSTMAFSWNDGTPTPAATTHAGLAWEGVDQGFELVVPALQQPRVLRAYLGVLDATARVTATVSDQEVPAFEDTFEGEDTWQLRVLTLEYGYLDADGELTITLSVDTAAAASAAVSLTAITIEED
jgi:hypothetical protein